MESLQNRLSTIVYKIKNGRLDDGVPMGLIHVTSSDMDGTICAEIVKKVHADLSEDIGDPMPLIQIQSKTVRSDRIVDHLKDAFMEAHRKCIRSVIVLITGFNAIDLECYSDIALRYNIEVYYDVQISRNGSFDWIGNMADTYSIMNPIELSTEIRIIRLKCVVSNILYVMFTPYVKMDISWTSIAGHIIS